MLDFNSMTKAEAAVAYAERLGWFVLPCWWFVNGICACGTAGCDRKHPISALVPNGQKDASNDPDVVAGWWARYPQANPAIFLKPSGLVALDVDQDKRPLDEWQAFIANDGDLPMALVARTGNVAEAYHYVFNTAALNGHKVRGHVSAAGDPAAHDTLIKHDGYIVVAPADHAHGRTYQWLSDNLPGDPGPVITPMITESEANTRVSAGSEFDGDPFDWPATVDAMVSDAKIPPGNQDDLLTRAAASLVAGQASDRLALSILLGLVSKFENEPGRREWTAEDAVEKLRRARANPKLNHSLGPGAQAIVDGFLTASRDDDLRSDSKYRELFGERVIWRRADRDAQEALDAAELAAARGPRLKRTARDFAKVDPPDAVIDKVLAAEVNLLGGPQEAGKSLLLRDWALAIAAGQPWRGYRVVEPRNVLLVASEGTHDFAERWEGQVLWESARDRVFVLDVPIDLVHGDDVDWLLKEYAAERPVVMFDVIYAMGMADDNGMKDVLPVLNSMKRISAAFGAATVAAGHPPHSGERRFRGSSMWRQLAAVDWHLGDGQLSCEKSKLADRRRLGATYRTEYPDLRWLTVSEASGDALARSQLIREDFERYPEDSDNRRAQRLMPILGLSDSTVRRLIRVERAG
ncbi:bifunctional DNA primase/polymerase [Kribbella sp.]|uniref:bifunctional DNA primase/polymerase n=1 Tax=Kribbella sp. TaxID=1871183 RepID=UPI002D67ACD2|nr:bifunctional DNA primase/polymerase [Kribbella sp.]HZX07197.1 bifunctional DNA primase/polymerase [Kribbella sp.]